MRSRTILRTAAVAMVAGLSIAAAASPAAAHHPEILRPFSATHDDGCTYVSTSGDLAWKAWHAPADTPGVKVWGEVGAEQRPICPAIVPATPFADFSAYIDDRLVDHQLVKIGEQNPTKFRLLLEATDSVSVAEIDRVEVRACLAPSWISPPPGERDEIPDSWCGEPDVHHRLVLEPK